MPYVDLPELRLTGDWAVTPAERTLAARMLPALPAAPPPGADLGTRWNRLAQTLVAVKDGMLADSELLSKDTPSQLPHGHVDMRSMPHYLMQALTSNAHIVEWVNAGQPAGRELLAAETDRLEPEVARLRELIAEVAQSSPESS